jgi:hypothetical protein
MTGCEGVGGNFLYYCCLDKDFDFDFDFDFDGGDVSGGHGAI